MAEAATGVVATFAAAIRAAASEPHSLEQQPREHTELAIYVFTILNTFFIHTKQSSYRLPYLEVKKTIN
jgi:hypothetical protein